MLDELKSNKKLRKLLADYGINSAYLFGSQLRGDAKRNSDIDLMIEYDIENPKMRFPATFRLKDDISSLLNKNIDLIDKRYIIPELKEEIISTAKIFFKGK